MKKHIIKIYAILLCTVLLASAIPFSAFAFGIDPKFKVDGKSASTLADAFEKAGDTGSVIMQDGKTSDIQTVGSGIEITKNVTLSLGKDDFNTNANRISYTGKSEPLFTIKNGGVLTVKYSAIYGNGNDVNTYGGLIRVEKGGTLILSGTTAEPVVISDCKLTAQNAKGGAIYAEQGGKVIVNGVTFNNNFAAQGADIYAEQKTDVTVAEGVTVNAVYGESVDISGLNLVLTGEIGLVFHTSVPEKYIDGSFVLTSRTSDTVTYKISECGKDAEGRYLAKYNLSSIELSEPVTLTVCGKDGNAITSKTKSAEQYGKVLLEDETVTEKEKNVVRTLLNYGHFAQIECSEYNGWEIGKDYAETAKYADLTTDNSVFDGYKHSWSGKDSSITKVGVQLDFNYKTNINLYFATKEKPSVAVNGETVTVEECTADGFQYRVSVKNISALDLAEEFEVLINNKKTLIISALSYCNSAIKQKGTTSENAVKALYEFYQATVKYNAKSVFPGEDTSWGDISWN